MPFLSTIHNSNTGEFKAFVWPRSTESMSAAPLFALSVGFLYLVQLRRKKLQGKKGKSSYQSPLDIPNMDDVLLPPLPDPIVKLLQTSRLCFLATCCPKTPEPHLALINFTYIQSEEILVFCTRRDTKKFEQIIACPNVAILVHDFPHLHKLPAGTTHGSSYSITLNGRAIPLPKGSAEQETYRAMHLENNKDYSQFIVGEGIAVIIIKVNRARLCDINDKVVTWQGIRVNEALK